MKSRLLVCLAIALSSVSLAHAQRNHIVSKNADLSSASTPPQVHEPPALTRQDFASDVTLSATYGRMPLSFEPNQGQADARVKFLSRGAGQSLFLTSTEALLVLQGSRQQLRSAQEKVSSAHNSIVKIKLAVAKRRSSMKPVGARLVRSSSRPPLRKRLGPRLQVLASDFSASSDRIAAS